MWGFICVFYRSKFGAVANLLPLSCFLAMSVSLISFTRFWLKSLHYFFFQFCPASSDIKQIANLNPQVILLGLQLKRLFAQRSCGDRHPFQVHGHNSAIVEN